MEKTNAPAGKNREIILLVLVALLGAAGLLVLQLARKTPGSRTDERALVQTEGQNRTGDATTSAPLQKIPGNLVTKDTDYPEVGQPFVFRMANFSQGAVYELDTGDGSPRKPFKDGRLTHVYQRKGKYEVTLYARFEGQEAKLETVSKTVIVPPKPQNEMVTPIINN